MGQSGGNKRVSCLSHPYSCVWCMTRLSFSLHPLSPFLPWFGLRSPMAAAFRFLYASPSFSLSHTHAHPPLPHTHKCSSLSFLSFDFCRRTSDTPIDLFLFLPFAQRRYYLHCCLSLFKLPEHFPPCNPRRRLLVPPSRLDRPLQWFTI